MIAAVVIAVVAIVLIVLIIALLAGNGGKRNAGGRGGGWSDVSRRSGGAGRDIDREWNEAQAERAGRRGEDEFARLLGKVLRPDDTRFRNVGAEYDGRRTELDEVVVNRFGVAIIEVKNYSGRLYGGEEDRKWQRIKVSGGGRVYSDTVDNPFGQLRREIDILARYLRSYGCDVWVEGYLYFVNGNCPVESERVLRDEADIDRAIHTPGRWALPREEQNRIADLLREETGLTR